MKLIIPFTFTKISTAILALCMALTPLAQSQQAVESPATAKNLPVESCTLQFEISGAIGVSSLDHLQRSIEKAKHANCSSALMLINTPGGSLQTTRLMVETMLASPMPILCLVYPAGAHAGSAGAILLQACHVSGAVEATNIGAATPISSTGESIPEDLRKKILNDTVSWLEGITKLRERDLKFSKDIVTEAKAVDAKEALRLGAIDFVGTSIDQFLNFSKQRKVKLNNNAEATVLVGPILDNPMDFRTKTLALVGDPETAYLIFMGSLGLLYFEVTHPGVVLPGVVGGIGLIVSLMSLHKLNVEWGAMALMLFGLVLLIIEAFVPSFGALGVGGIVSFVVGSLFLFDAETTGHSLSLSLILPTAILFGGIMLGLAYLAFQTRNLKKRSTYDVLLQKTATVVEVSDDGLSGYVEVNGETWKFLSESRLEKDHKVKVVSHSGLVLNVEKK